MSWDRKKRGASTGYFYVSVRTADKPHPRKVYCGRSAAGHDAAAAIEQRRLARQRAREAIRAEREATAEADQLARELREWVAVLSKAWLTLCGLHNHKGSWRRKRGKDA